MSNFNLENIKIEKYKLDSFSTAFSVLIFWQILVMVYFASTKQHLFVDEIYTLILSNYSYVDNPGVLVPGNFGKWFYPDFWNALISIKPGQEFSYGSVWWNQGRDVHPPLYYAIVHTLCSIAKTPNTFWHGLIVNIVCFAVTQYFLLKISFKALGEKKLLVLLPCLFYGFCWGNINCNILMRMYSMLTMFTVISFYLHLKLIAGVRDGKNLTKIISGLCLCNVFGFMTQYYYIVVATFMAIGLYIYAFASKHYKIGFIYTAFMSACLPVCYVIFPNLINHIFRGYRGNEAFSAMQKSSLLEKLPKYFARINGDLFGNAGYYYFVFLIVISAYVIYKFFTSATDKYNESKIALGTCLYALVVVFGYVLIIFKIAPTIDSRYLFPVYPLFCFAFICILMVSLGYILEIGKVSKCNQQIICISMVSLLTVFCAYNSYDTQKILYMRQSVVRAERAMANKDVVVVSSAKRSWPMPIYYMGFRNAKRVYLTTLKEIDSLKKLDLDKNFICLRVYPTTRENVKQQESIIETYLKDNLKTKNVKRINKNDYCASIYEVTVR